MSYNGWKNWETWNVALWLGNDEGVYRAMLDKAQRWGKRITAKHAETLCRELMPDGTPDFKSGHHAGRRGAKCYGLVQWSAIADTINEMAGL